MNIYDHAHAFARNLKRSKEYEELLENKEKLKSDGKALEMLKDLRKSQWELQRQKMAGLEVSEEQEEKVRKISEIVNLSPLVKSYLDAEYRFMVMMQDVQKIMGEAIKETGDLFAEDSAEEKNKAQPDK